MTSCGCYICESIHQCPDECSKHLWYYCIGKCCIEKISISKDPIIQKLYRMFVFLDLKSMNLIHHIHKDSEDDKDYFQWCIKMDKKPIDTLKEY
jgi:hypothetical protein